jgi:uncharacterized protein (TIGR03435 family)
MVRTVALSAALLWAGQLHAQEFEAASVRAVPIPKLGESGTEIHGGPGTNDPGQITYSKATLSQVLRNAFGFVWDFQYAGPAWLDTDRYTIVAKIPPGTTREQFRVMLQHLLAERLGFKFHREQKPVPVYELVVAKGGSKLKESTDPGAAPAEAPRRAPDVDGEGFPILPPGVNSLQVLTNRRNRISARLMSMVELAGRLERETDRPVIDRTGLTGKYDLKLDYSIAGLGGQRWVARIQAGLDKDTPDDGGPDLFTAVQQQLGLKLEDRKEPFEVIVIDQIEKMPAEN